MVENGECMLAWTTYLHFTIYNPFFWTNYKILIQFNRSSANVQLLSQT